MDKVATPIGERNEAVEVRASTGYNINLVSLNGLKKVEKRPPFSRYVADLIEYRHFVKAHARSQAFGTGRGTFLGRLWMILDPLLQVMMYALIFGFILHVSRGIDNFIGFLAIGVTFFRFLSNGFNGGVGLIQRNRSLITSFNFPRVAIPIGSTLRSFLDNLIPGAVAVGVALLFQLDKPVQWTILLVPVFYVMIHVFAAGLTMITARISAFIPDTRSVVRVLVQALFFLSGVFFPLSRFGDGSLIHRIMELNPFYQFLEVIRLAVLDGLPPSLFQWGYLATWTILTFLIGFVFFWRKEGSYARIR